MTICVFLGPTLPHAEAEALCPDLLYLPPVQFGDVFSTVQHRAPDVLALVDGYFQQRPSVWHKEILWALDQGIQVYGAASMGALRAAELERFGMRGVGKVFEGYRAGALPPFDGLHADDEVAVVHGPAETGYLVVTEALVNIRHTLESAVTARIIDPDQEQLLVKLATQFHFSKRDYKGLLQAAKTAHMSAEVLERLTDWLPDGRIDQKRLDAIALIKTLSETQHPEPESEHSRHVFQPTEIWQAHVPDMQFPPPEDADECTVQRVLDELRLDEPAYAELKRQAVTQLFLSTSRSCIPLADGNATDATQEKSVHKTLDEFRRQHNLPDRDSIDAWLEENDMDEIGLDRLIRSETNIQQRLSVPDHGALATALIDRLRLTGRYQALARRARDKSEVLSSCHVAERPLAALLDWYYERMRQQPQPTNSQARAQRLGLTGTSAFARMLNREYAFVRTRNSSVNKS